MPTASGQDKPASPHHRSQAREKRLKDLQTPVYRPVDYAALLIPREFAAPPEPSFDYLVDRVRTRIEVKYFFHYVVDAGVIALFVALAVATVESMFSPVFLLGAVAGIAVLVSDNSDKKKALASAIKGATATAAKQIEEFRNQVAAARAEFEQDERNRLWQVRRLAEGNRDAVMQEAANVIGDFGLPFPLAVTLEMYGAEPLITLKFPADDFVPKTRISGDGAEHPKMAAEIRRQYLYSITGAASNLVLGLMARIPLFGEVCVNAFIPEGEGERCVFGARVKRSQAEQVAFYDNAAQFVKILGSSSELQPDGSLATVEPLQPTWRETAVSREVQKSQKTCKVEE